jgi:hypothetical protein
LETQRQDSCGTEAVELQRLLGHGRVTRSDPTLEQDRPGHWGAIVTLGTSAHFFESSPGIAFDGRGDATVAWRGYTHVGRRVRDVIRAAYRPAHGRFGRAGAISPAGTGARSQPVVAMNPRGRSYVAWTTGIENPSIDVAARDLRGRWGAPQRVSSTKASEPRIAVAFDGTIVVAWREAAVDTEGNDAQVGGGGAAIAPRTGMFAAAQHVADVRTSAPLLAISPSGEIVLAWDESESAGFSYAIRVGTGGFGAPQQVPGAHADALAILSDGCAVAYWAQNGNGIRAITRPVGGQFGAPQTVSATGTFPTTAPGGAVAWLDLDASVLKFALPRQSRSPSNPHPWLNGTNTIHVGAVEGR